MPNTLPFPPRDLDPYDDTLKRYIDGAYTAAVADGGKVLSVEAIMFVSTAGNDSNDGLSYASAKATIAGAQAAVGSIPATIYLGKGTFTGNVALQAGQVLRGLNRAITTIKGTVTVTSAEGGGIFDVTVDGTSAGAAADGVTLSGAHRFSMERVTIQNFTHHGLRLVANGTPIFFCTFSDIDIINLSGNRGISLEAVSGTDWITGSRFVNVSMRGGVGALMTTGVYAGGPAGAAVSTNLFERVYVEYVSGDGFFLDTGSDSNFLVATNVESAGTGYHVVSNSLFAFGAKTFGCTAKWNVTSAGPHTILSPDLTRLDYPVSGNLALSGNDAQISLNDPRWGGTAVFATHFDATRAFEIKDTYFGVQYMAGNSNSGGVTFPHTPNFVNDIYRPMRTVTASTALNAATDWFVAFNGSGLTATLPDPTTVAGAGAVAREFVVANINASPLTLVSAGSGKTIDGQASISVPRWSTLTLVPDGTQWLTSSGDPLAPSRYVAPNGKTTALGIVAAPAAFRNVMDYGATGNGATDDTAAIQACINAGGTTWFPPGQYRITNLSIPAGAHLLGSHSGGHGIVLNEGLLSSLQRVAGSNLHMIEGAQGAAHVRIEHMHLDGNKNNNTAGDGIHLDDVGTAEEAQWRISNCFIEANPGYGIYLGTGRRASEVTSCGVFYSGASGVKMNGSDSAITKCIVGTNAVDGIQVGAPVTRVTDCDVYGNGTAGNSSTGNAINILSTVNQVVVKGCGMDRNLYNAVYVSTGAAVISLIGNIFHSNSQDVNGAAHHINVKTTTGSITLEGNVFGTDGGMSKAAGYCVFVDTGASVYESGSVVQGSAVSNLGFTNDYARLGGERAKRLQWAPTGAQAVNMERASTPLVDVAAALVSGRPQICGGAVLPGGMYLTASNKISVLSGATAGASLTHCWFALVDQSGNVLAKTTDDTSGSWASNTVKTLNFASAYFVPKDTPVYIAIVVAGTTPPSIIGTVSSVGALGGAASNGDLPVVAGHTADSGLTTPASLGATTGAFTADPSNLYGWVS